MKIPDALAGRWLSTEPDMVICKLTGIDTAQSATKRKEFAVSPKPYLFFFFFFFFWVVVRLPS